MFKLKPKQPLESDIQDQILAYLYADERVAWACRMNGGGTYSPNGRYVYFYSLFIKGIGRTHRGYADLHGMLDGGRYFALEVKRPKEKPTKSQLDFINSVKAGGGIAAVVSSWEEAKNVLFGN